MAGLPLSKNNPCYLKKYRCIHLYGFVSQECFFEWTQRSEWSVLSLSVPLSSLFIIISVLAKK